jgi:hypothetical protein
MQCLTSTVSDMWPAIITAPVKNAHLWIIFNKFYSLRSLGGAKAEEEAKERLRLAFIVSRRPAGRGAT